MKHTSKLLLIAALAAVTASSLPVSSHASQSRLAPVASVQGPGIGGPGQQANGALYAMACGFGIRYWPALGWNFAYNVGVVGFCMLALMDALS